MSEIAAVWVIRCSYVLGISPFSACRLNFPTYSTKALSYLLGLNEPWRATELPSRSAPCMPCGELG
jgi:hypothetical protein